MNSKAMDVEVSPLARSDRVMDLGAGSALLLRNARILDVQEGTLQPGSVLIENGIISSIRLGGNPLPDVGNNVQVLDLEGGVVMPGMMDLEAHPTGRDIKGPFRGTLPTDPGVRILRAAAGLLRTLEAGFTTIRCLGHGTAEHFEELKTALALGLIKGPRMLTCGWAITPSSHRGRLPYKWIEDWRSLGAFADVTFADGVAACRQMVRRNIGMGADVIKVVTSEGPQSLPCYTLEEVCAITEEAHRRGKRVAAHAVGEEGVRLAVQGNVDTIQHGWGATTDLLEEMSKRGIFLVPTLTVLHHEERLMYPDARSTEMGERLILAAKSVGVKIACATDSDSYIGDNAEELVHLVQAGLSPQEAIAAATRVSAEALGLSHQLGQVKEGFLADLVIVNANPLKDIRALQQPQNIWRVLRSQSPTNPAPRP